MPNEFTRHAYFARGPCSFACNNEQVRRTTFNALPAYQFRPKTHQPLKCELTHLVLQFWRNLSLFATTSGPKKASRTELPLCSRAGQLAERKREHTKTGLPMLNLYCTAIRQLASYDVGFLINSIARGRISRITAKEPIRTSIAGRRAPDDSYNIVQTVWSIEILRAPDAIS
eukprot:6211459-Pleurochrysis_carterae.AAC.1